MTDDLYKPLASFGIIAELVEAGAGRGEENRVAGA
jgi:hypothetical protein